METIQIQRQYRFIDPDKDFAEANGGLHNGKWRFQWDMTEVDEATDKDSGYILPGEYIVKCKSTNAVKAMEVKDIELPTSKDEAQSLVSSLDEAQFVDMVRYVIENREKESVSSGLMERHESPEKAAKRLEKKQAKAAQELQDWMLEQVKTGNYPSQDAFNSQVRVVYGKYDLEFPTQD